MDAGITKVVGLLGVPHTSKCRVWTRCTYICRDFILTLLGTDQCNSKVFACVMKSLFFAAMAMMQHVMFSSLLSSQAHYS